MSTFIYKTLGNDLDTIGDTNVKLISAYASNKAKLFPSNNFIGQYKGFPLTDVNQTSHGWNVNHNTQHYLQSQVGRPMVPQNPPGFPLIQPPTIIPLNQ